MAKYPEEILKAGKSAQKIYDLAQEAELEAKRSAAKAVAADEEAKSAKTKADKIESERNIVRDVILQNESQLRNAFANWDTLTEPQFRAVTKLLFRALVKNELQEGEE